MSSEQNFREICIEAAQCSISHDWENLEIKTKEAEEILKQLHYDLPADLKSLAIADIVEETILEFREELI